MEEYDEQKSSLKAQFAKHAQAFDDLQHEMAGRDVGRISRFLNADAREDKINGKRGSRKDSDLTNLQIMMMNDPAYAALYRDTMKKLAEVETATEIALQKAHERLAEADRALEVLLDRAATLDDGHHVFRDNDGRIYDEDDQLVLEDVAKDIDWPAGAPSRDDHLTRKEASAQARAEIDEITLFQVDVLGTARDRMSDQDNPLSAEEFKAISDSFADQIPDAVREVMSEAEKTAPQPAATAEMALPKI